MIKDDLTKKIVAVISNRFGDQLAAVILYGSYAENRETDYSDIDLLIVLNSTFADWRKRRQAEVLLRKDTSSLCALSPKLITEKELLLALENYNPLVLNALSLGKPIYDTGIFSIAFEQFKKILDNKVSKTKEGHWKIAL